MDMKKSHSSRMRPRTKRTRKGDTGQLAAQLAPLEEQDKHSAAQQIGSTLNSHTVQSIRDYGAIVVDNDDLNVPKDIMEGRDEKRFLGMEPVVLAVLIVMLTFIAFIAWRISQMPAQ
jgi:hypothetical protein